MSLNAEVIFSQSPVIPVLVINQLKDALPLAKALVRGGIKVIEITLRTPFALDAINQLTREMPDIIIGVGTVISSEQLNAAIGSGAQFAISPGATSNLLQAGKQAAIPFIPGISSISELMQGIECGYQHFKLFPAELIGGISMLKTIYSLFPWVNFCPTGGINESNFLNYLKLPNVQCVGGTWIISDQAIQQGNWIEITERCLTTCQVAKDALILQN